MAGPILQPQTVTERGTLTGGTLAERVDSLLCANLNAIYVDNAAGDLAVVFALDDGSRWSIKAHGCNVTIGAASGCTEGAH